MSWLPELGAWWVTVSVGWVYFVVGVTVTYRTLRGALRSPCRRRREGVPHDRTLGYLPCGSRTREGEVIQCRGCASGETACRIPADEWPRWMPRIVLCEECGSAIDGWSARDATVCIFCTSRPGVELVLSAPGVGPRRGM